MENEKKDFKIIIIIPAFNEEESIGGVIKRIPKIIDGFKNIECLVIDDGSKDNTYKIAQENGAKVISHTSNKGVGAALATGIDYALKCNTDVVVNIDADGQFNPEEILTLVKPIKNNQAEMVVGDRFQKGRPQNMSLIKYYGNKLMNSIIGCIAGEKFKDVSCGFRAYSREALLNQNLFGKFTYTQEAFLDMKFKNLNITQVPVEVKYFKNRKSKVANNLLKYAWKTMNIILRTLVYYRPLRFFGYPGIVLLLIGLGFISFLVWHKLWIGSYSPYKAYGFIGGGMTMFGLVLVIVGLITDIIDKVRRTQEKLLYYMRKNKYK